METNVRPAGRGPRCHAHLGDPCADVGGSNEADWIVYYSDQSEFSQKKKNPRGAKRTALYFSQVISGGARRTAVYGRPKKGGRPYTAVREKTVCDFFLCTKARLVPAMTFSSAEITIYLNLIYRLCGTPGRHIDRNSDHNCDLGENKTLKQSWYCCIIADFRNNSDKRCIITCILLL